MILIATSTLSHQPSSNIVSFFEAFWSGFLQKDQCFEITMDPTVVLTFLNLLNMKNQEANQVSPIFKSERFVYSL